MKKFALGVLILLTVFACNQNDNRPYPPPPGYPSPLASPNPSPLGQLLAQIQSGSLRMQFTSDHLVNCETNTQLDGTMNLRLQYEAKDQGSYFAANLLRLDPQGMEHRTTDFMSGWMYVRIPYESNLSDGEREYRVYYDVATDNSNVNSLCTTHYSGLGTDTLTGSFSCVRLYNSRGAKRDFQGSFQCKIKKTAP